MSWNVEVNGRVCIASGMCSALAPDYFALDGAHSRPVHPEIAPDEVVLDAADSCPASAITVTEAGRVIGPTE
ncbi:ferredoxin [Actinophytocola sp.]|uniref:ferredoxin n=1 Tax=Actinophytocola sp. TaxID=1872138 RepID=UPI002D7FC1D4|nr:ferredoxin [Actinophytocola sp.]HET9139526.1 ferredoxin [Actinophytocola sp.]